MGDEWHKELVKYPFISSKYLQLLFNLDILEKPGRAIFLIKERTKLIRAPRKDKKHTISSRLSLI
jgi:hypothetical protein